jgi:hypothetical protein
MSKQVLTLDLATGKKKLETVIDDATKAAGRDDMAYTAKAVDDKVTAISGQIDTAITSLRNGTSYQNAVVGIFKSQADAEGSGAIDGARYAIGNLIKIYHAEIAQVGTLGQPGYVAHQPKYWELIATVSQGATLVNLADLQEYRYNSALGSTGYNQTSWYNVLSDGGLVHTYGNEIIGGSKTFANDTKFNGNVEVGQNLTIDGDLTVKGTTTNIDTTNLVVKDNMILLNQGDPGLVNGGGITLGAAGLEINRGKDATGTGDLPKAQLIYDENVGTFQAGLEGELKNVALINDSVVTSTTETYSVSKIESLFDNVTLSITNSTLFTYVAGEDLTVGQIAYVGTDGRAYVADNTNAACMDVIAGIVMKDTTAGSIAQIAKFGKISKCSGLAAGTHYFLGTAGTVTNVCPTASGSFICGIGAATDDTTMLLQLGEAILIA